MTDKEEAKKAVEMSRAVRRDSETELTDKEAIKKRASQRQESRAAFDRRDYDPCLLDSSAKDWGIFIGSFLGIYAFVSALFAVLLTLQQNARGQDLLLWIGFALGMLFFLGLGYSLHKTNEDSKRVARFRDQRKARSAV
eukprot:PLAT10316.1.p2 GENE.PLAT10316.1~~PLAT10316.1.p2  ORF type:complete len:139 (+),score=77.78 PLAT10316.1:119-535(+)